MERAVAASLEGGIGFRRATLAGLCGSLVGIGLARFAYTPLLPALIGAHWFAPAEAAYLGAANLAGYLAGALLARRMAAGATPRAALRAMMALATASFFACATPLSFLWFFLWRFASGLAGGALMALAAPTVLPCVPVERRGLAGGIVFTGVGLGIAASATLVPLLVRGGLAAAWCGLGAASLALTAAAWRGWPEGAVGTEPAGASPASRPLRALYVEYALAAVGLVPHMVFFVDFVARGLGRGLEAGARYWVLFGIGAVLGPALAGRLADRIGFRAALRLAFLVQGAAVALLLVSDDDAALAVSSVVVGGTVPGIVPLVLGRIHELLSDGAARQGAWSRATAAFALGQAGAAYLCSFLFARGGGYGLLFALGAGAVLLAFLVDAAANGAAGRVFVGQRGLSPRSGGTDAYDG